MSSKAGCLSFRLVFFVPGNLDQSGIHTMINLGGNLVEQALERRAQEGMYLHQRRMCTSLKRSGKPTSTAVRWHVALSIASQGQPGKGCLARRKLDARGGCDSVENHLV